MLKNQKRHKEKPKDMILSAAMMLVRMVVLIYVGLAVVLVVLQKRYIYYPNNQDFYNCPEFEEYKKVLIQSETRGYYLDNGPKVLV